MAVVVTVAKGHDLSYVWKNQARKDSGEKALGGYCINAAQAGEPPGRWWGPGARALGFSAGQAVERKPYDAVYQQRDPRTGAKLGRARGSYLTFTDHLVRLKAAEPHATAERLIELEREAAQAARQPAAYADVTVSFSKSISVLHASIRENERQARLTGDQQAQAYWAGREARFQEILHSANRAAAGAAGGPAARHGPRRLSMRPTGAPEERAKSRLIETGLSWREIRHRRAPTWAFWVSGCEPGVRRCACCPTGWP